MFIILGLGNPGPQYTLTRHNVGFRVLDRLSTVTKIPLYKVGYHAFWGKGTIDGRTVILAKPMTYMNNSGLAAAALARQFKVTAENILVIHDDLDLPFGMLRMRAKGSSGGHNGLKSLIFHLQTESFPRLKIGIGRPQQQTVIDYVLEPFPAAEEEELSAILHKAAAAVQLFVREGIEAAMNTFNSQTAK
ncbi:MAG TPA: aminoacyl-tRNA hydrolase [Firmicutes bacterium]|jgi:PTH1 family peptidyl-tRNA hydrolase|nr:aminoacyl-tRNA hydrolase [Bacillota bacterium]HAA37864.1 aminoacyl-tRNA hydrolase [Bacillota bacterium]